MKLLSHCQRIREIGHLSREYWLAEQNAPPPGRVTGEDALGTEALGGMDVTRPRACAITSKDGKLWRLFKYQPLGVMILRNKQISHTEHQKGRTSQQVKEATTGNPLVGQAGLHSYFPCCHYCM